MSPQKLPTKNKKLDPFEDHLTTLFEELQLADHWNRPSILLAAYRSKLVLIDAQVSLEKRLRKVKQTVFRLEVNPDNYDIPLFLSQYPDLHKTVFFISGLRRGGGATGSNAYRALNMRRELLVDHRIRAIFWLNEEETDMLPMQALDFWSFRHRMVELLEQPRPERVAALVKALNWPYWNLRVLQKEIPAGLTLREELLSEIPETEAAAALRAELIHMLAALHWAQGEYSQSQTLLNLGLDTTQKFSLFPLQSRYWDAIGLVRQALGQIDQAIEAYQTSLKLDPISADAWGNLGSAYRHRGQATEAMQATQKSIDLDPKVSGPWNNLGDLYCDSRQVENAVLAYKNSLAVNSQDAQIWLKLGEAYRSLEQPGEALRPFKKAKQLNPKDAAIWVNLGVVYRDLGLINCAIRAFYKATRLAPLSPIPWKNLGDIYRENNRLIYAQKAYKTANSLDPEDKSAKREM